MGRNRPPLRDVWERLEEVVESSPEPFHPPTTLERVTDGSTISKARRLRYPPEVDINENLQGVPESIRQPSRAAVIMKQQPAPHPLELDCGGSPRVRSQPRRVQEIQGVPERKWHLPSGANAGRGVDSMRGREDVGRHLESPTSIRPMICRYYEKPSSMQTVPCRLSDQQEPALCQEQT